MEPEDFAGAQEISCPGRASLVDRSIVEIRKLRRSDIQGVQDVALRSWTYTYHERARIYAIETIRRTVSRYYATESFEHFVLPQIRRKETAFHVAVDRDRVVGYSQVGRGRNGWELFRIYLLPECIGRGIGRELLRRGEAFLRRKGATRYITYIHRKNALARDFYLRQGFVRHPPLDRGSPATCFLKVFPRR